MISIPFQICSPDIADKLSITLISHVRNAPRYAPQSTERMHASGISLGFRNGGVFLSDMTLENVRVYSHILPVHPCNLNRMRFILVNGTRGYSVAQSLKCSCTVRSLLRVSPNFRLACLTPRNYNHYLDIVHALAQTHTFHCFITSVDFYTY